MRLQIIRFFLLGFFFFSSAFAVIPSSASAAGLIPCGRTIGSADEMAPCTICHVVIGGNRIIEYGLQIMTVTAIAVIVAMAIFYIISTGDEGMMKTAKGGIKAALIGFAVMLGAWLIVNTTLRIFSVTLPGLEIKPTGFSFTCDATSLTGSATGNASGATIPATPFNVLAGGTVPIPAGSSVLFSSPTKITVSSVAVITAPDGTTQQVSAGSSVTVPANATLSFPSGGTSTVTLPEGGNVEIVAPKSGGSVLAGGPLPAGCDTYQNAFVTASAASGVPVKLLKSIASAESSCNPNKTSSAGSCGLMQLTPTTAHSSCQDLISNPQNSIQLAANYLKTLQGNLDAYKGTFDIGNSFSLSGLTVNVGGTSYDGGNDDLIASYNAGSGNSLNGNNQKGPFMFSTDCPAAVGGNSIPAWQCPKNSGGFQETQIYVQKVQGYMKQ